MKKTSGLILASALIAGACHFAQTVCAAAPSDKPPEMTPLEEGDPAVSSQKKTKAKQTGQAIQNGQQSEVKVTNGIGTYIVKPNQNVGTSLPGDAQSNSNNPVQWVIKSWGGSKDSDGKDEAPPVLHPNSAPPASKI